jgi:uncharacterized membrane protein YfcA
MFKNTVKSNILIILLGVISGILSGAFGLGITTLALPGFLILGLVPDLKTSIGTALISSPSSWPAAYEYYKNGFVDLFKGILFFICHIIGSYYGAFLNMLLTIKTLNYTVGFIYFILSLYFFQQGMKK